MLFIQNFLHGEPVVVEEAALGGLGAYGEDAAIDAHVSDLHFVGDAAPLSQVGR